LHMGKHRGNDLGKFCMSCSKSCSAEARQETLHQEAAEYDSKRSQDETPSGSEPALQGLLSWLPADPSLEPLPHYSEKPEPLAPLHCRLCFADCPAPPADASSGRACASGSWSDTDSLCRRGVHPHVVAHLQKEHPQVTADEYRRRVMHDAVSQWPHAVSAQVMRSRLQAYSELLTDANFAQAACACCARLKRRLKLCSVVPVVMCNIVTLSGYRL
jgi:hypothetical protein